MILHWCPSCGAALPDALPSTRDWSTEAITAWQLEIADTCQHVPRCAGPWAHAVRAVRDIHDHAKTAR